MSPCVPVSKPRAVRYSWPLFPPAREGLLALLPPCDRLLLHRPSACLWSSGISCTQLCRVTALSAAQPSYDAARSHAYSPQVLAEEYRHAHDTLQTTSTGQSVIRLDLQRRSSSSQDQRCLKLQSRFNNFIVWWCLTPKGH